MTVLHGVAIGDPHLDALRKHFPNDHLRLQLGAITKALTYAFNAGATDAFLLGDIGQGYKDVTTGRYIMSEAARVGLLRCLKPWDGKLRIHAYAGNHDTSDYDSSTIDTFVELTRLGMFGSIQFYTKPTLLEAFPDVAILPYPRIEPLTKKPCLNFAHYEVGGAVTDSGMKSKAEEEYRFGKHQFIQGHLHTKQRVRNHYYPGTLYQMSFGEKPVKGFTEFWWEDGKIIYKPVRTDPPYKLINLRVYTRDDLKQIGTDPFTLYKLFLADDVTLKATDEPRLVNVVNRLTFATEEEANALEAAELVLETNAVAINTDEALDAWLLSKGQTKADLKHHHRILRDLKV